MKKFFMSLIFLLLVGCINNPYKTHYKSFYNYEEKPLTSENDIEIKEFNPPLPLTMVDKYIENGYYPLGYSEFVEENLNKNKIKKFAKEIGANLAIYSQRYLGERSYQTIMTMPVYSTTNSSGSFYNYDLGSTYYSGTSTTQTMQYIPITETMYLYKYESIFFKKLTEEEIGYGVEVCDINDIRDELGISKNISEGIVIRYVVKGSQAYKDGFLRGDIIKKIGKKKIINLSSLEEVEPFFKKKGVVYEILRNGKLKKIEIKKR